MSIENPLGKQHGGDAKKLEGVLGNIPTQYAEDYYPEMAKLKDRIAANEEILRKTMDINEIRTIGQILQRDKAALITLKAEHNVPLSEDEKLAA